MRRMLKPIAMMTLLTLALTWGSAAENRRVTEDLADDPHAIAAGFLNYNPDLQYRPYGIRAYGTAPASRVPQTAPEVDAEEPGVPDEPAP